MAEKFKSWWMTVGGIIVVFVFAVLMGRLTEAVAGAVVFGGLALITALLQHWGERSGADNSSGSLLTTSPSNSAKDPATLNQADKPARTFFSTSPDTQEKFELLLKYSAEVQEGFESLGSLPVEYQKKFVDQVCSSKNPAGEVKQILASVRLEFDKVLCPFEDQAANGFSRELFYHFGLQTALEFVRAKQALGEGANAEELYNRVSANAARLSTAKKVTPDASKGTAGSKAQSGSKQNTSGSPSAAVWFVIIVVLAVAAYWYLNKPKSSAETSTACEGDCASERVGDEPGATPAETPSDSRASEVDAPTDGPATTATSASPAARGFKQLAARQFQSALSEFEEALKQDKDDAQAYLGRGLALMELNRAQAAILDFDKTLELSPELAWAYFGRGRAKLALGDEGGYVDMQKAGELDASLKIDLEAN